MNWLQKIAIYPGPSFSKRDLDPDWRNLNSLYDKNIMWDRSRDNVFDDDSDESVWSYDDHANYPHDDDSYLSIGQTHGNSDVWKIDFEGFDVLSQEKLFLLKDVPNAPLRFVNMSFAGKTLEEIPMEDRHEGILDHKGVNAIQSYDLAHGWVDNLTHEGSVAIRPYLHGSELLSSIFKLVQSKYPGVQFFVFVAQSDINKIPLDEYSFHYIPKNMLESEQ